MKATNSKTIARTLTATTALAVCGLLPIATPDADAAVNALLKSGGKTLKVVGDNTANDVDVLIDDTGSNLVRVYDGGTLIAAFPSDPMEKIQIVLKGGDDTFFVGLQSGSSHKFEKDIDLKLGSGNDSGFVDFRSNGGLAIVQGSLEVDVNAGSGDDEVHAHFARKHGGKLDFTCKMSAGDDECSASMWGDISGSADVKFDLKGGGGDDSMWSWNTYDQKDGAYGDIRISGDSTFELRMDGGGGLDTLTPTFSGEADGDLKMLLNGKGDADSSWGIINLGSSSSGEVVLLTSGSGGDDDLRLDVTGSTPYFSAAINGGGGTDTCQSTANVSKTACP